MENLKHTPAPWKLDERVASDYFPIYHENGSLIAEINTGQKIVGLTRSLNQKELDLAKANAKLIAAAPELLKALQQYEKAFQQLFTVPLGKNNEESLKIWFTFCTKDANNAIKKATE